MNTVDRFIIPTRTKPIPTEEYPVCFKNVSCIPLIGIFVSAFNERSLACEINRSIGSDRLIELINIKNEYKVANTIRNFLSAAFIIVGVALGILNLPIVSASLITSLHIALAGINIYHIGQNRRAIDALEEGQLTTVRIV